MELCVPLRYFQCVLAGQRPWEVLHLKQKEKKERKALFVPASPKPILPLLGYSLVTHSRSAIHTWEMFANTSSSLENQDLNFDQLQHKLPNPKFSSQAQLWGNPKWDRSLFPRIKTALLLFKNFLNFIFNTMYVLIGKFSNNAGKNKADKSNLL